MSNVPSLLFIEDDVSLAGLISRYLDSQGLACRLVHRGDVPLDELLTPVPDLILLDLMLPGKDGLTLCKELRTCYFGPIVLLTALDSELNEIMGLETGANDYVVKTTPPSVLLARIRTQLRQARGGVTQATPAPSANEHVVLGGLDVDRRARRVSLHGEVVGLTTGEFELLWALIRRAGDIVSRDELSMAVRGIPYDGLDRTVDITLSRLRKKLGDDAEMPEKVKTIRAKGYLLAPDVWN